MRITLDFNLTDPENGPVLDDSLPNAVHEYVYKKVHCEFMNKLRELRPISLK